MIKFEICYCSTFIPPFPFRLQKSNLLRAAPLNVSVSKLPPGCQFRPFGHTKEVINAELTPSLNDKVDWVIVDVLVKGDMPSNVPKQLNAFVEDDSKLLLRTALKDAAVELSVLLCTDAEIRTLNLQWRGKDTATDVLSFPQNDPDRVVLGDIAISVETANEQALARGLSLRDEIRILLVHGLLHLMGYDHEGIKAGDWMVMAQMENRFLRELQWKGEGLVSSTQDPRYRDFVQP